MITSVSSEPVTARYPGVIQRDCLYTADEIKNRLRWSKGAFRSARRLGLKVRYHGGRAYIAGSDVLDFMASSAKSSRV